MKSYRNSDTPPPIMQGSPPPEKWRVPRDQWDQPPWNRWSFQNVRQIVRTAPVSRGVGKVLELKEAHQEIGNLPFTARGATKTVDAMLEETYTDGFLILHRGAIAHESYYNGMAPDTLHLSQSVAKSITSTVAGKLIGDGLLSVDEAITTYLPELEETAWQGATVRQVLDMTTGVKFDETYTDPLSDIAVTDVACGWKPVPKHAPKDFAWPHCMWEQILSLKEKAAEHGERFLYRSIETDVLAHAMERVTSKRLWQLTSEILWSKIGAEYDASFTVDASGYAIADGGFNATLRDYGRFGLLHLNGGQTLGKQVIPADWIDDIQNGDHGLFNQESREHLPNGQYRNMFWIEETGKSTVLCLGVFGQMILISPKYDLVAVKLSTWPDFLNPGYEVDTIAAINAIGRFLNAN